jgi:hypothetical protein
MLALSGFGGFITGLLMCYLYFRPTNARAEAFDAFQRDHLFYAQYALNHGNFDEAVRHLDQAGSSSTYAPAHEVITAMHQLVVTARAHCQERDSSEVSRQ